MAEKVSPPVLVATLTIPKQDVDAAEGRAMERLVDQLSFNPWYTTDEFRPLGNMNRARKEAYRASSAHRLGHRFHEEPPLRNVIAGRDRQVGVCRCSTASLPWHRLPSRLALFNLAIFRDVLREKNLIDTAAACGAAAALSGAVTDPRSRANARAPTTARSTTSPSR